MSKGKYLNARELGAVLAALRHWQGDVTSGWVPFEDIATNAGEFEALSSDEVNALCEELNCGGGEEKVISNAVDESAPPGVPV